jgi:hypothetical protein
MTSLLGQSCSRSSIAYSCENVASQREEAPIFVARLNVCRLDREIFVTLTDCDFDKNGLP